MRPNGKQPFLPESSYEYGPPGKDRFAPQSMKDWEAEEAMRKRNRNALVLSDGVFRNEWGGVERVQRPPMMSGRRWRFLEKW